MTFKDFHKINRENTFSTIRKSFEKNLDFESNQSLLAGGDSLSLLKNIPPQSISLILTDPPYHSTKKQNIYGDTNFKDDNHYLAWIDEYAIEWSRILRPNGSLYLFCATPMAARLEGILNKRFNILSHIVWTKPNDPGFDGWKGKMRKESLRQWYAHSERILFAEPAAEGNIHRSHFANFLKEIRMKAGFTAHKLTEITGAYGKVNHGGAVSNWETGRNIPNRDQYDKISEALETTGKVNKIPPYEDVIRPFMMSSTKEFTDVWNFPSVRPYQGKHPAEKPIDMLMHAIESTTYPYDIVLDCFGGSGNTALAAIKLGRLSVTMEIEKKWIHCIREKLKKPIPIKIDFVINKKKTILNNQLSDTTLQKPLLYEALSS